jgi:hypothetical protein
MSYHSVVRRVVFASCLVGSSAAHATSVTTYHYDTWRTGWNQSETTLTPANVGSSSFGLVAQQPHLDEQVDAQPLYVPQQIFGGIHFDVVYVATENDSIYAIDASTGNILLRQNYGNPVLATELPGHCDNNASRVGFNSTPVYDPSTNTIYAISYTWENSQPTFRLHSINASTLRDNVASVVITATGSLKNGESISLNAKYARQRPALLEVMGVNGGTSKIYAGFGGFCDVARQYTRGWILGWYASRLDPLPGTILINQNATSPLNFFMSDVWMSGYGLAADALGNVYFVTANSDRTGRSYEAPQPPNHAPPYNLEESVVQATSDLETVVSYFTPLGQNGYRDLDHYDYDFGAGGVLLLPDQPGLYPRLAVAAGKMGPMYLLNRDNLGGLGKPSVALGAYKNDGCWCGQSYYVGADGIGRVVESTGDNVRVWKVETSNTDKPKLALESTSPPLGSGQDPGFFTSISSNGQTAGTAVIWAVARPTSTPYDVYLEAFDPGDVSKKISRQILPPTQAGAWNWGGSSDADIVPVVADGRVFVASYKNLSIFGLSNDAKPHVAVHAPPGPAQPIYADAPRQLHGVVTLVDGGRFTLKTRIGKMVRVDASAIETPVFQAGQAMLAAGTYDSKGVLVAKYVLRQKPQAALWGADR